MQATWISTPKKNVHLCQIDWYKCIEGAVIRGDFRELFTTIDNFVDVHKKVTPFKGYL